MDSHQYTPRPPTQQDIWRARPQEAPCEARHDTGRCTLVPDHPAHVKHEDPNGGQW